MGLHDKLLYPASQLSLSLKTSILEFSLYLSSLCMVVSSMEDAIGGVKFSVLKVTFCVSYFIGIL